MISNSLKEFVVSRIRTLCGECTIYLFGSYAYDNPTVESDLDIAVIMDHVESKIKQAVDVRNVLKSAAMPQDILVASKAEFEFYRHEAGSVFRTIADKGVVLYG